MKRSDAARLGRETAAILERGGYQVGGELVDISEALDEAIAETVEYPAGESVPRPAAGEFDTEIRVVNETTLAAARRLDSPVALNFASAKNPGGGFLSGARAQEESLARASGLYACIRDAEMYPHHGAHKDPMYTGWAIHSPRVPVFRGDDGALFAPPFLCGFITCAAVNAGAARRRGRSDDEITAAMSERVDRVLAIAAHHGHRDVVLGAWGCGVFGNSTETMAALFGQALEGRFAGVFERAVFAIVDWSEERRFIGPFRRRFGGG